MALKSDSQGFLIADERLALDALAQGIEGVHADTTAILRLLQGSARTDMLRRQRAQAGAPPDATSKSSAARAAPRALAAAAMPRSMSSAAAPARTFLRDERGRFISSGALQAAVSTVPPRLPKPVSADVRPRVQTGPAPAVIGAGSAPLASAPQLPAPATNSTALVPVTNTTESLTRTQALQAARQQRATQSPQPGGASNAARDGRGRFVGKGRAKRGKSDVSDVSHHSDEGADDREPRGLLARLKSAFGHLSAGGVGDFEKVDPTIEAAKEVGGLVRAPLAAIGKVGGAVASKVGLPSIKNPAIGWYRRIFGVLKQTRDESRTANLIQERTLKEIDKKSGGGIGGMHGGEGGIGGLLGGLLERGGGFLKGGGRLLGKFGRFGMKGMRRLPLLGALFAGGSALASMFGPDDPNKSAAQNHQDRYSGAGSGIGAIIGGGLGTLVGGPIGTMIGGVIGDKVGELVGGWLATVDWSAVGKEITGAWDGAVGYVKDTWKAVTDKLDGIAKTVGTAWTAIVDGAKGFLKDKLGIDVDGIIAKGKDIADGVVNTAKEVAAPVVAKAKEVAAPVVDVAKKGVQLAKDAGAAAVEYGKQGVQFAKDAGSAAVDYGKGRVERMAAPIGRVASAAKGWVLGQTSKLFESGKGGAATVSSGKGDHGGASYGTYQLSSSQGTLQQFLSSSEYGADFAGLKPGTAAFDAKWKEVAQNDPTFGDAQHDFIKSTHYDPAVAGLKNAGIDLSERGAAVQDAIWSSSVQFGAGSAKRGNGAIGMFQKALAGRDVSKLSDEQIVSALQDYKLANNDRLFAKSSAKVRAGTAKRAEAEKANLLSLAKAEPAQAAGAPDAATAAVPASDLPPAVAAAAVPDGRAALYAAVDSPVPAAPAPAGTGAANPFPDAPPPAQVSHASTVRPGTSPAVRAGETTRASARETVADVTPSPVAPTAPSVTAVAAPSAPPRVSMARMSVPVLAAAAPAAQPSIAMPMNSAGPMEVRVTNDEPVGQDLRNRRLAQIATGGIAV